MKMNAVVLSSLMFFGFAAFAAAPKTYQVTGPVLEVSDSSFVVQKGTEKWEILKEAGTTVTGELKVGAKVTVKYKMIATDVEAKAADAKKKK